MMMCVVHMAAVAWRTHKHVNTQAIQNLTTVPEDVGLSGSIVQNAWTVGT